jgi:hypothetical protein
MTPRHGEIAPELYRRFGRRWEVEIKTRGGRKCGLVS